MNKKNFNTLIINKKYKLKLLEDVIIKKQDKKLFKKYQIISKNIYKLSILNKKIKKSIKIGELTKREKEVYNYICKGMTNKQISEKLFVTENTLKKHVSNILSKMNKNNRSMLIVNRLNNKRGITSYI
jgi:two-component system nitrate/nitrite response regulator NarL